MNPAIMRMRLFLAGFWETLKEADARGLDTRAPRELLQAALTVADRVDQWFSNTAEDEDWAELMEEYFFPLMLAVARKVE